MNRFTLLISSVHNSATVIGPKQPMERQVGRAIKTN